MRPLLRLAALSVLLLNACYPPGDGKAPPLDEIYFPTGAALDGSWEFDRRPETTKSQYLYIANSDFDLQYRSSSLISYNLDLLSDRIPRSCNTNEDCNAKGDGWVCDTPTPNDTKRVPTYYCVQDVAKPCGDSGERVSADQVLYPGRCNPLDPADMRVSSVGIGAFASDVIWRPNCDTTDANGECENDPEGRSRLFIPVRGDSTLHWIDVLNDDDPKWQENQFDCGQNNGDEDGCDAAHRSGDTPDDNIDRLEQNPEPFGVDATEYGEFVVVTNQTTGTVSLYHDEGVKGPMLVSIASGLPFAPIGIAAIPKPTFAEPTTKYEPGFLVTYRNAAQVDLLRAHEEPPFKRQVPRAPL